MYRLARLLGNIFQYPFSQQLIEMQSDEDLIGRLNIIAISDASA
jgi:hypothetical protein